MKIIFRIHAIQRMFERQISAEDVRTVLEEGETIESYEDDMPYPSRLVLGWRGDRPIHIVAADNSPDAEVIVVTVYEPDLDNWEAGFSIRRKR